MHLSYRRQFPVTLPASSHRETPIGMTKPLFLSCPTSLLKSYQWSNKVNLNGILYHVADKYVKNSSVRVPIAASRHRAAPLESLQIGGGLHLARASRATPVVVPYTVIRVPVLLWSAARAVSGRVMMTSRSRRWSGFASSRNIMAARIFGSMLPLPNWPSFRSFFA